jgi:predicted DNA repair protein MutK
MQAVKGGSKAVSKAAGIVIDDAAVTPRYVVGFAAQRELPIVGKIASGSLKNKLILLMPGALLLNFLCPWIITPLLMIGGAFLCYEGWHKVADMVGLHGDTLHDLGDGGISDTEAGLSAAEIENVRVQSAIRTDFILSAEIMAITLSTVASSPYWLQGAVLAVVGLGMTFIVYGAVAIIVKLDDFGALLARQGSTAVRTLGRGIVIGMPIFLQSLSFVGMIAMLWVGGGILVHGLHVSGIHAPEEWINEVGASVNAFAGGFGSWIAKAALAAVIGLAVGAVVEPLSVKIFTPAWKAIKSILPNKSC